MLLSVNNTGKGILFLLPGERRKKEKSQSRWLVHFTTGTLATGGTFSQLCATGKAERRIVSGRLNHGALRLCPRGS